ncbi:MAG: iron(III) transport system ATP-binding protein [Phycisphaerales bacterium]|jgi:iron(III) transport system ATP-binding protein
MSTDIHIESIKKVFGSGASAATAVDGVTLNITPGELFFLLGPSGCGKTTLLRMIAGFIDPTAGAIRFDGNDVTHMAPNKRNTGMVFQSYALWPHMTVAANVAFGLDIRKVGAAEKKKRVREALAAVQMEAYADRKPTQLSGGQQQRVALARALVIRPAVLLLDEPLSNLDAKLRNDLRHQIRKVCKDSGLTTVYVTHDQKEALSMADRVALLRDGKVMQLGTPREIYRRPNSRFVAEFLGETNLIEAKVISTDGDQTTLETPAGRVTSTVAGGATVGGTVLISLRPEAIMLAPASEAQGGTGVLSAIHAETTYLGETAQHLIDLPGAGRVKVAELNPFGGSHPGPELCSASKPGTPVGLRVHPDDVVVLPQG